MNKPKFKSPYKFKFPLRLSVKFNVSVPQPNPQLKTYEDVNMYFIVEQTQELHDIPAKCRHSD